MYMGVRVPWLGRDQKGFGGKMVIYQLKDSKLTNWPRNNIIFWKILIFPATAFIFALDFEPFTLWIWPLPKHESCSPVYLVSLCKISAQTELPFARYEFFSNRTSTRKFCLLSSTLDPVLTTLTIELNFCQNTKVVDLWIRFPSVYRTPQLDFSFESYDFSSDRTSR